jgi:hypothetical protein
MGAAVALFASLLIVVAMILWQLFRGAQPGELTYGIADATAFIERRLPGDVTTRLGTGGIRRVIEWEVFYLQGLGQADRRQPVETVAGDYPEAVAFIEGEIARRHGLTYSAADISAVLEAEVGYLQSIGAIGDEVGGSTE